MVIQSRNYGIIYWFIKRNFFQSIWISNYDKKASWCRYCYRYPISDPSNKTKIWRKKLQESVQSAQTALISKKKHIFRLISAFVFSFVFAFEVSFVVVVDSNPKFCFEKGFLLFLCKNKINNKKIYFINKGQQRKWIIRIEKAQQKIGNLSLARSLSLGFAFALSQQFRAWI